MVAPGPGSSYGEIGVIVSEFWIEIILAYREEERYFPLRKDAIHLFPFDTALNHNVGITL